MNEADVNGVGGQSESKPSSPVTYKVEVLDASKDGELVKYTIKTITVENNESDSGVVVLRQFEDFEYLYHCLIAHNDVDAIVVPPLPPKPSSTPAGAEAKSKKQLGNQAKTMVGDEFLKDCKTLQSFLELVIAHPQLNQDETLRKFLTADEPPVRASVKKGMFNSLMKQLEDVRFHHHKDIDDDFQQKREYTDEIANLTKICSTAEQKAIFSCQRVALCLGNLSSTVRVNASIDNTENRLTKPFTVFANALDQSQAHLDACSFTDEDTLGFCLELYTRYLVAAKEMLLRRTIKLVEFESASKALDKAKPKNVEQAESVKMSAEQSYETISKKAAEEMDNFSAQRIQHIKAALVDLAEGQIENGKKAVADLRKSLEELRECRS